MRHDAVNAITARSTRSVISENTITILERAHEVIGRKRDLTKTAGRKARGIDEVSAFDDIGKFNTSKMTQQGGIFVMGANDGRAVVMITDVNGSGPGIFAFATHGHKVLQSVPGLRGIGKKATREIELAVFSMWAL